MTLQDNCSMMLTLVAVAAEWPEPGGICPGYDKVNIYGGFVDFGYKCYIHHFFFNIEVGLGILAVDHNMTISSEKISYHQEHYYHPPKEQSTKERHLTVNFSLTLGGAL